MAKKRRSRCKRCGELHYNFEPCVKASTEDLPVKNEVEITTSESSKFIEPPIATVTMSESSEQTIEPITEHPRYEIGQLTPVPDLMARIETLEDRVNHLIDALSKSKKVKGI